MRLERRSDDLLLVLGSEGLFEVLSPETILQTISDAASPQDGAGALIAAALAGGAPDNASAIVVDL